MNPTATPSIPAGDLPELGPVTSRQYLVHIGVLKDEPQHTGMTPMHPEQIKAEIRMKGSSPAAIATALQVTNTTVSHVIHSRGISNRVARRICEVTGISADRLWPGKYPQLNH